jgi:hypothetical protein
MIERAYDTQCTQESRYKKIVYTMKILLLCRGLGAEQRRRGGKGNDNRSRVEICVEPRYLLTVLDFDSTVL